MKVTERKVGDVLVVYFHGRIGRVRTGLFKRVWPPQVIRDFAVAGQRKILLNLERAQPGHCQICTGSLLAECSARAAKHRALLKYFYGNNGKVKLSVKLAAGPCSTLKFESEAEAIESFARDGDEQLVVTERRVGDVVILDVTGNLSGGPELRTAIETLLDAGERRFLLNFEGVGALEPEGLGGLVATYTLASDHDAQFKLLKPTEVHKKAIFQTVLSAPSIFECFDDEAEAIESFRAYPF